MKTKNLVILALLVGAALAGVFFLTEYTPGTDEKEIAAGLVMNIPTAELRRVEISSPKGDLILVRDEKNRWQIAAPVKYPAAGEAVADFLSRLAAAERRRTLTAAEVGDPGRFGLDPGVAALKLTTDAGRVFTLALGKETAVADHLYARVTDNDRESFVVIDQSLLPFIHKEPDEWRSRAVFDFAPDQVLGLRLRRETGDVEIKKNDAGEWRVAKPLDAPVDESAFRSFLAGLLAIRADKFVADNPAEAAAVNSPYLLLELDLDDQEPVTLTIGKIEGADGEARYYARQNRLPAVFTVPPSAVDLIFSLPGGVQKDRE